MHRIMFGLAGQEDQRDLFQSLPMHLPLASAVHAW